MSYAVTKSRILQWLGIILIIGVFAGAYWYYQSRASTLKQVQDGLVTSGLVGFWSFNDADVSGSTVYDRSLTANNGTTTDTPARPTRIGGKINQAILFNGFLNYMTIPNNAAYNVGTTVSYSVWIKMTSIPSTYGAIFRKTVSSFEDKALYIGNTGQIVFYLYNVSGGALVSNTVIVPEKWYHVVATYDGTTEKIFINGELDASQAASGDVADSTGVVRVGGDDIGTDGYFPGSLDELRFYNRTLSQAEINTLYRGDSKLNTSISQPQGTGRLDSGLAGYWKLDDGSGTSAVDSSTNGNTGTLTGGPTWTTGQVGSAVDFDGTDDYVTAADADTLDIADSVNFTFSGWFNRDIFTTDDTILAKSNGQTAADTGYNVYIDDTTDKLTFVANDGTDQYKLESVSTFTATGWHHYSVVWDESGATQTKLYINGVSEAATATGTFANVNTLVNAVAFRLGAESDAGNPFDGKLDEIRLYNRALSVDEVAQLYHLSMPTATDTGLKGYWSFNGQDMLSSTTTADRSGAGNTGTLTGGPTRSIGKLGQALSFDGSDDYVSLGSATSIKFGSGDFTYAIWMKTSGTGDNSIVFGEDQAENAYRRILINSSGFPVCSFRDATANAVTATGSTSVEDGNWHHVICVRSGTTGYLYVDGILISSNSNGSVGSTNTSSGNLVVGYRQNGGGDLFYTGSLDEARAYSRALTAAEIKGLYDVGADDKTNSSVSQPQGTGRLDSGLAGYWKLDDGSGTSATDASTNANTGTLTSGPTWTTGQIGGAVDFDGTDDYIAMGDPASGVLDMADSTNFTLSGWFNRDTFTTDDAIVSKRLGIASGNSGYIVYIDDATDKLTFEVSDGTDEYQLESVSTFTATGWHHYTIVWDDSGSGQTKLYINGASEAATATGTFANVNSLANSVSFLAGLYLDGVDTPTLPFDGKLDDIRVYSRALSAGEVAQLYRLNAPTGIDTGLKGYWSFNGPDMLSSTTFADRSGAGNTATLVNGPTKAIGKIGQAINFDGSDDYVSVADNASLDIGDTDDLTLTGWFYRDTFTTDDTIIAKSNGQTAADTGYNAYIDDATDKVTFVANDGTDQYKLESTLTFTATGWNHFTVVWDQDSAANSEIYINGTADSATDTGTIGNLGDLGNAVVLAAGAESDAGSPFDGKLDEVRTYKRAFSAAEAGALYNASR